jgi:hypothetical protein
MDEIEALRTIDNALAELDEGARQRSLEWMLKKYGAALHAPSTGNAAASPTIVRRGLDLSVTSIAQRLGATTAEDVLRAAAVSLTFVHGREHFPWKDLLAEAGRATGYWTKHHPSNATKAAKRLKANSVLVELANGDLALDPSAKEELAISLGVN